MKVCRQCLTSKPFDAFHKYPRNADGRQSYCASCQAENKRAKYAAEADSRRREALERYRRRKATGIPQEVLAAKSAYDAAYRVANEAKLLAMKAEWRKANPSTMRAIAHSYKARRRAQERAGDSTATISRWIKSQPKVCRWCCIPCESNFHLDHVMPLARGGSHTVDNLCISCPECNVRKNAKHPEQWQADIERHRCDVGMLEA